MKVEHHDYVTIVNGMFRAHVENGYAKVSTNTSIDDPVIFEGYENECVALQELFTEIARVLHKKPELPLSPEEIKRRYGDLAK